MKIFNWGVFSTWVLKRLCGCTFRSIVIVVVKILDEDKVFEKTSRLVCNNPIDSFKVYTPGGGSPITMQWITHL